MKTLSLTQPWASLIALGEKRIETRSWGTSFRGPLAIHASKGLSAWIRYVVTGDPDFDDALDRHGVTLADLPLGCVIATAVLRDVLPTASRAVDYALDSGDFPEHEEAFGDFGPNRFAWLLTNVHPLPKPIPAKGSLGLWEWCKP